MISASKQEVTQSLISKKKDDILYGISRLLQGERAVEGVGFSKKIRNEVDNIKAVQAALEQTVENIEFSIQQLGGTTDIKEAIKDFLHNEIKEVSQDPKAYAEKRISFAKEEAKKEIIIPSANMSDQNLQAASHKVKI